MEVIMVVPKGWLEQKEDERDTKFWTQRFDNARNGKEQWDVVKAQYLNSPLWKKIRIRILNRANGKCEKCNAIILDKSAFDIHHWTYDRIGGKEKDDDLSALCYSCHKKGDRIRERNHEEDRLEALYYAKMRGFAERKYGDLWEIKHEEEYIEQEGLKWLYNKYCKQEGERFELDYDDQVPEWFRDMVWNDEIQFDEKSMY